MTTDPIEVIARCGSHARTLREIGEETMASDIEELIKVAVRELAGGR